MSGNATCGGRTGGSGVAGAALGEAPGARTGGSGITAVAGALVGNSFDGGGVDRAPAPVTFAATAGADAVIGAAIGDAAGGTLIGRGACDLGASGGVLAVGVPRDAVPRFGLESGAAPADRGGFTEGNGGRPDKPASEGRRDRGGGGGPPVSDGSLGRGGGRMLRSDDSFSRGG